MGMCTGVAVVTDSRVGAGKGVGVGGLVSSGASVGMAAAAVWVGTGAGSGCGVSPAQAARTKRAIVARAMTIRERWAGGKLRASGFEVCGD